MNNLLLSISRNSFSKILETFLEQIRWCHSCKMVDSFAGNIAHLFGPQVRQRKFFNRLVNSLPNSSFLTTRLLMRPMWPMSWPCDKSIRIFFDLHWVASFFRKFVNVPPPPQKKTHFFTYGKVCRWTPKSADQPQIHRFISPKNNFCKVRQCAPRFRQGTPKLVNEPLNSQKGKFVNEACKFVNETPGS